MDIRIGSYLIEDDGCCIASCDLEDVVQVGYERREKAIWSHGDGQTASISRSERDNWAGGRLVRERERVVHYIALLYM